MIELEDNQAVIRLRLLIQNNCLKEEIKKQGFTVKSFALKTKIHWVTLSQILNLRRIATEEQKISVACVLLKPIDFLFPDSLDDSIKHGAFDNRTKLLNEEEFMKITSSPLLLLGDGGIEKVEESINHEFLSKEVLKTLNYLKPIEREVIILRFGLEDRQSQTLEEVAKVIGLTSERVRQIEAKALRELRHPSRSRKFKDYLE